MTDPALNSGVQIRSHRYPEETTVTVFNGKQTLQRKMPKGRVHGYQVEIANEAAVQNGSIYDEARRGWVAMMKPDRPGRQGLSRQSVEPLSRSKPGATISRPG